MRFLYEPQAFNELCESDHFSKKSFLWAIRKDLVIRPKNGQPTKREENRRVQLQVLWFLKLDEGTQCG